MSREIDLTKPLSDEDREYLEQRNRLHDIDVADAGADEEVTPPLPPAVTGVPSLVDQSPEQEPASALGQEREREGALTPERQADESLLGDDADGDGVGGAESTEVVPTPSVSTGENPSQEPASEDADNYDDKDAWSFDDLRDEARKRDLATGGTRADIIARLRTDDSKES